MLLKDLLKILRVHSREDHTNSASGCFFFLPVNKLYFAMEFCSSVLIMLLGVLDGKYTHTEE